MEFYYQWLQDNFYKICSKKWKITFEIKKEVINFAKISFQNASNIVKISKGKYYMLICSVLGMFITALYLNKTMIKELSILDSQDIIKTIAKIDSEELNEY